METTTTTTTSDETFIWIHTSLILSEGEHQTEDDSKSLSSSVSVILVRNKQRQQRSRCYNWVRGCVLTTTSRKILVRITDTNNHQLRNKTIILPSQALLLNKNEQQQQQQHVFRANVYFNQAPPNDLIHLTHLHEPALVECLQLRYNLDQIYTYTGPILLALNPFKPVKELYSDKVMQYYYDCGCSTATNTTRQPHVYAIADDAFRNMIRVIRDNRQKQLQSCSSSTFMSPDQSILVSGESGAGKTVTTKFIMAYLASLSERAANISSRRNGKANANANANATQAVRKTTNTANGKRSIEQQVLQSNPILESFGNARTLRNDNSSRFGKFISINFSHTTLLGACIRTYLLEKVRLVHQMQGERTYHIFYELLSDTNNKKSPEHFKMTSSSNTFDRRDGVLDKTSFQELKHAMDVVGFTKQEQTDVFAITSAILHASNLIFVEQNASTTTSFSSSFVTVATLLGVDTQKLNDALCTSTIAVAGKTITKTLSCQQAIKANESMMKALYGVLFSFLVNRINQSISSNTSGQQDYDENNNMPANINVLDIFGFESFDVNSFEQLCINYCNEALQQQFNRFVFKLEQEEYEREGIEWSFIEFPDNQDVLDLIDHKRTGIMSVLNEQCRLARSTDRSFATATIEMCKDQPRFGCSNMQKGACQFSIQHYAGSVEYTTTNFIEKNKDELPQEGIEILLSSSNSFVAFLGSLLSSTSTSVVTSSTKNNIVATNNNNDSISSAASGGNKSSLLSRASVCTQFSAQLRELRERIERTSPHYVRCLKPNDLLLPNKFEPCIIADQLRCAGVLEAIRVSRVGFPQRYQHDMFLSRYYMLASKEEWIKSSRIGHRVVMKPCEVLVNAIARQMIINDENSMSCRNIANKEVELSGSRNQTLNLLDVGIQLGRTKVFLRRTAFDALECLRIHKMESSVVKLQSKIRAHITRLFFHIQMYCIVVLQTRVRQHSSHKVVLLKRYMMLATKIQSFWRMSTAHLQHKAHLCLERNVTLLQTSWRVYKLTYFYALRKQLAAFFQGNYRCRVARIVRNQLQHQARDLVNIIRERDRLHSETLRMKEIDEARKKTELQLKSKNGVKKINQVPTANAENAIAHVPYNSKSPCEEMKSRPGILLTINSGAVVSANCSGIYRDFPSNPTAKDEELRHLAEASIIKDKEIEALRQELDILRKRTGITECNDQKSSVLYPHESASPFSFRGMLIRRTRRSDVGENPVSDDDTRFSSTSSMTTGFSPNVAKSFFHSPIEVFQSVSEKVLLRNTPPTLLRTKKYSTEQINALCEWDDHSALSEQQIRHSPSIMVSSTFMDDNHRATAIHEAVSLIDETGLMESLDICNDIDIEINMGDTDGKAALHLAAINSSARIAQILLDRMAMVNVQDVQGNTPLHYACHVAMIELLIEKGKANPNIPNAKGIRPLHLAVARKHTEAVEYLVANGADADVADDINWFTPLHVLVQPSIGCTLFTKIMPNPRQVADYNSQSAVSSMAIALCNANADLNSKDREGNTPFHYAARLGDREALELLGLFSKKGGNPKAVNLKGQTPLHYFCNNVSLRQFACYHDILQLLVLKSDPNIASQSGCTALHLALYHKDIDAAEILVKHGALLNLPWSKPENWIVFFNDKYSSTVLPLDMVTDEHSLRRLLSAISQPQQWADGRSACMNCKSLFGAFKRQHHCRHCGRLVCGPCSSGALDVTYFPPSFISLGIERVVSLRVCVVCEDILTSRKKLSRVIFRQQPLGEDATDSPLFDYGQHVKASRADTNKGAAASSLFDYGPHFVPDQADMKQFGSFD